jgi:hypothetical protein
VNGVFEFLTPFILKCHNFLNFILFLTIFNALDAPIGMVQICLNTKNNGALLLDLAYFEFFNVIIAIQFATNQQLKDT